MRYDAAIIGLGAMGSAALAECARRGSAVIGLEQFARGHELGSSTGRSRMIRKAYFEDPAYVPLLLRAYEKWRELEQATGTNLLCITGLLMVGHEAAEVITGALRAAREHRLSFESLTAREIRRRYSMLQVQDEELGVYEPDGGVLDPEQAVETQLRRAVSAGATIRFQAAMKNWEPVDDGFVISLQDGTTVTTRALILSSGPWLKDAFKKLGAKIQVQRNVQCWFTPATNLYAAGRFPPFLLDRKGLPAPLYGFPDFGDGVKAAFHAYGDLSEPDDVVREIEYGRDVAPVVRAMNAWMPGAANAFRSARACPYSLTSDGHFVVDRHPEHNRVVLCGGFSGHGFKFAPVMGEIAADLALEGATDYEIGFLSLRRLT